MFQSSFNLNDAQSNEYRRYAGDGIFRLSAGIEDAEDLCDDLDQVLNMI